MYSCLVTKNRNLLGPVYMRRASPVRWAGPVKGLRYKGDSSPVYRDEFQKFVYGPCNPQSHARDNWWISCFGSKWRFILALSSTEWHFQTKDEKTILWTRKSGHVFKATHASWQFFIPANQVGPAMACRDLGKRASPPSHILKTNRNFTEENRH